jgi:hypothetical protein
VRGRFYSPVALHPRNNSWQPLRYESGWAPELIWTFQKRGYSLAPRGNRNMGRPARSLVTTHVPTSKWSTKEYYQPNNLLATWGKIATESTLQLFQLHSTMHARSHAHTYGLSFIADQTEAALSLKKPASAGISCDSCRVRDSDKRYERSWVFLCWQVSCKDELCSLRVRKSAQYTTALPKSTINRCSYSHISYHCLMLIMMKYILLPAYDAAWGTDFQFRHRLRLRFAWHDRK